MPIPFVDAHDVARLLEPNALMDGLEAAHRKPMPMIDRVLLQRPNAKDAFLVMPAWADGAGIGIKLVTSFPENPSRSGGRLPGIHALYVLFDDADGRPLLLIDGEGLTFAKTSCDSGLGARFLARTDAASLLMVGAGALAPHLAGAHLTVRPTITRVRVWNRTRPRAEALAADLKARGLDAAAIDDLDAAVAEADVISCATGATEPLVKGKLLKPGAHVDLVGSFTPTMREADDDVLRRGRFFVDSRPYTIGVSGELMQPMQAGVLTEEAIQGDLFTLSQGTTDGRRGAEEITVFKNGGGAHLDLMTALLLKERMG